MGTTDGSQEHSVLGVARLAQAATMSQPTGRTSTGSIGWCYIRTFATGRGKAYLGRGKAPVFWRRPAVARVPRWAAGQLEKVDVTRGGTVREMPWGTDAWAASVLAAICSAATKKGLKVPDACA